MHSLTTPGRLRAMTALLLLAPGTPMLFQGQEFAASAPFLFFADHNEKLAKQCEKAARNFYRNGEAWPLDNSTYADPCDCDTFDLCKLDHAERDRNAPSSICMRICCDCGASKPFSRAQNSANSTARCLHTKLSSSVFRR